jgi:hypothetical protein
MTPIDGIAGTYLVSLGESLRLYFNGRFYAPDSDIPPALAEGTPARRSLAVDCKVFSGAERAIETQRRFFQPRGQAPLSRSCNPTH